jgi:hypothetical protein
MRRALALTNSTILSFFTDALNYAIRYVRQSDKETLRISAASEIALRAEMLEVERDWKGKKMTFADIPRVLYKMAYKAEVKNGPVGVSGEPGYQPGDDPEKVRIFFIVSVIKYMIDVNMKKPTHAHMMKNGSNAIGHSWVGNGARRFLVDELRYGSGPPSEWSDADVSQKDTQFKATDLLIQLLMSAYYYREDDDYVLNEFLKFSAHEAAFKVVRWLCSEEVWVLILGVLFSGDLETSHGNTNHMGTCWNQFVNHTIKLYASEFPPLRHAREDIYLIFKVQGDDVFQRTPCYYVKYLGSRAFNAWLKKYYGMFFKPEEHHITDDPVSYLDLGLIKEGKWRLKKRGNKFLKRYFVWAKYNGKRMLVPFREATDYFVRMGRSVIDQNDPLVFLVRAVGLLWDTMGTNPEAEGFLKRAIVDGLSAYTWYLDRVGLPAPLDEDEIWERVRNRLLDDEWAAGRAYRWSISVEELSSAVGLHGVSMAVIRDKFLGWDPAADRKFEFRNDRLPTRDNIGLHPPNTHPEWFTSERDRSDDQ